MVSAGGTTISATLIGVNAANLAADVVSAGGSAVGLTVGSGGADFVFGSASNTTVFSGGDEIVEFGGTTIGSTLSGGFESLLRRHND